MRLTISLGAVEHPCFSVNTGCTVRGNKGREAFEALLDGWRKMSNTCSAHTGLEGRNTGKLRLVEPAPHRQGRCGVPRVHVSSVD